VNGARTAATLVLRPGRPTSLPPPWHAGQAEGVRRRTVLGFQGSHHPGFGGGPLYVTGNSAGTSSLDEYTTIAYGG